MNLQGLFPLIRLNCEIMRLLLGKPHWLFALSIAEYVHNQPEISDVSKASLHHLKLDLVHAFNFSWRTVPNDMLMLRSIALENLSRTIPLIDEDLLHAPFKGTTFSEAN